MKKVIVTGGLGFIGSNLIDLLIKKNYFVINIDKVTYSSNFYNVKEHENSKKYKFIKFDIKNRNIKKRGTRPFDYNINIEINNELTPSTWKNKEI